MLDDKLVDLSNFATDDVEEDARDEETKTKTAKELDGLNDFSCVVIAENIPKTHKVKALKEKVIKKLFGQIGTINYMDVPTKVDEKNRDKSIGMVLIEYSTKHLAAKAIEKLNGFRIDKKHKLRLSSYAEVAGYLSAPDKFEEPSKEDFRRAKGIKIDPSQNLKSWLTDRFQRDQFVVRFQKTTQVNWVEYAQSRPTLVYDGDEENKKKGKTWCERYVTWSPKGTFLATFHQQGIALWGGEQWKKVNRFAHMGVEFIEFSPRENFMVSWNGNTGSKNKQAIKIFDLKTGKCRRPFAYTHVPEEKQWPNFKWSHDDQFVGRVDRQATIDLIAIYETKTMKLLDNKSLRAPGVTSFSWSPTNNIIAFWAPETENIPARITVMEIPSRKILQQKVLYSVKTCDMYWHDDGHFLCVQVTRFTKSKKRTFTNFEIFRMRDVNIPVETLRVDEQIRHFAFEKNGVRFGVVHGDTASKSNVSFYTLDSVTNGAKVDLVHVHQDRPCDTLYWSPLGNYVVLAGQQSPHNGMLEFYDVSEAMSYAVHEHFMCTDIKWDPSGRICASAVCQGLYEAPSMRMSMQSGYRLWSFMGEVLHKEEQQEFFSFDWRPRPASLLSEKQIKEVLSPENMRVAREEFRHRDKLLKNKREALEAVALIKMRDEFRSMLNRRREKLAKKKEARLALLGFDVDDPKNFSIVEETFSEVLDTREEIMD